MKRSKTMPLTRMRKTASLAPVSLAGVLLSGCAEEPTDAVVYRDAQECIDANPEMVSQCNTVYRQAQEEALRTGPKFNTEQDCEYDFGAEQCQQVQAGGSSFFMPFMAGYMLSNLMSPKRRYYQPMWTSYAPGSRYRNRWFGARGTDYGSVNKRNFRVAPSSFAPKPTVNRTIRRGGFGASVRKAKMAGGRRSWGG